MQYDEIIKTVIDHGGSTERETAEKITRVVLADLGKQLTADEAKDLAGPLPQELESVVTERSPDDDQVNDDVDDFLRRVAKHLGDQVDPEQARSHVRAVFATLNKAVTEGEVADLRSQLPAGFGPLFE